MSGDAGAHVCVPGALAALAESEDLELVLVGAPAVIEPQLERLAPATRSRIQVRAATQVVAMDEAPREAIRRKKDSSLRVAIDLVAAGEAAACVSAGNTGALMATAHFVLGMIHGVERPAIVARVPAEGGHTFMLDLGANAAATASQLCQFAVMGAVVAADLAARPRPRVGLLNIGSEDIKGHALVQEAHERLQRGRLNYAGFVEGGDIFTGKVDVVVTDGFTGNVALKTMEGLARMIGGAVRSEFTASPWRRLSALAAAGALGGLRRQLDPRRYNGASMVGLRGIVIKSHGGADATAFAHAVRVAAVEARNGVPTQISQELEAQAA
ncbi:MAG: phosphate acyltransferase PlsX [Proteobacteria bacterium]|nr:phosphate acyltransferase PlsX [Pseudomonadota bacterium]